MNPISLNFENYQIRLNAISCLPPLKNNNRIYLIEQDLSLRNVSSLGKLVWKILNFFHLRPLERFSFNNLYFSWTAFLAFLISYYSVGTYGGLKITISTCPSNPANEIAKSQFTTSTSTLLILLVLSVARFALWFMSVANATWEIPSFFNIKAKYYLGKGNVILSIRIYERTKD